MQKINVKNKVLKKGEHYVTSDYKIRNNKRKNHNGIDMVGKNSSLDEIVAIANGEVINAKYHNLLGYYIEIKHANNYISRYQHLRSGSLKVKKGDKVNKGDILGYMGNTGHNFGAHLHFAILNDKRVFQDPLPYLLGFTNFNNDYFHKFVINIQKALNAKVDGYPGKETLSKTITISKNTNSRHPIVKYLQEYFYELGYTNIGKIDGIAGPKFTKVVTEFQKQNNIMADGIITKGNKTWQKILKLI